MKRIVLIGDSHTRSFAFRDNIIPVFLGPGKEKNQVLSNVNKKYIAACCDNYIEYANFLNAKILTPTTGYAPSIEGLKYLTKLLKEKAKELIIDIFSETIITNTVKPFLLQKNYLHDPIHLNISKVFLDKLSIIDSKINIDNFKCKDNFIKKIFQKFFGKTFNQVKNRIEIDYPELYDSSKLIPVEGKVGTLIVFDSDIFHLGGLIEKKGLERLVLRMHSYLSK